MAQASLYPFDSRKPKETKFMISQGLEAKTICLVSQTVLWNRLNPENLNEN